ncbi:MAG: DUF5320 domain-containing protein [Bacteroidales bacterium]|nr:DUF5320 domain-containing protein [Bacteroidales bacterium]
MPGGDKTGPQGQGSRTGKQLGYCSGYDSPGYTRGFGAAQRSGIGRGFGTGRGGGRRGGGMGRSGRFFYGYTPEFGNNEGISTTEEINLLSSQAIRLKHEQENIEKRIEKLKKEKNS